MFGQLRSPEALEKGGALLRCENLPPYILYTATP